MRVYGKFLVMAHLYPNKLFVFFFLIYNSCIYRVFHIYKRANIAQL